MRKTFVRIVAAIMFAALCIGGSARAEDTVLFGVTAPLTGNNILVGEFVKNGALLAQKEINDAGGILGKKLELVFEDEVDNLQTSVNAMTKLLNYDNMVGFFGSTYSSYCIAMSPMVLEKKIPMMAGGSSANIPKENNPFIWQARMTDDTSGYLLAKTAVEIIGSKNPAILHIAESFGTGLMEQTVAALDKMGVKVDPAKIFAHIPDEKQFGPLLSQIEHSGADCLIAISHQMPASVITMQVEAAGLDMPLLGSVSFSSIVVMETAGEAANGWYSVTDWTPEADTPPAKAFTEAYRTMFAGRPDPDMPAVVAYDSVKLFAEACRLANTTTDPVAINDGLGKIKAYPGAMTTYTPNDKHCFATSQFFTETENKKALLKEVIYAREP